MLDLTGRKTFGEMILKTTLISYQDISSLSDHVLTLDVRGLISKLVKDVYYLPQVEDLSNLY